MAGHVAPLMGLHDVGVVQVAAKARLVHECLEVGLSGRRTRRERLEGHDANRAVGKPLLGAIDPAMPPSPSRPTSR